MTDEELIFALRQEDDDHFGRLYSGKAADRIEALNKREHLLWDLLEEIDAQIDLAEEIGEEFAEKVRAAVWENG